MMSATMITDTMALAGSTHATLCPLPGLQALKTTTHNRTATQNTVSLIGQILVLGQVLVGLTVAIWLMLTYAYSAFSALALGVLVALSLHAIIILLEFGLAAYAGSAKPLNDQLSLVGWAGCIAGEIAASFMTFSARQPFFGARALASAPDTSPQTPIVFIHGFFCNRAIWRPAALWLAARGHPTESVNLEPVYGSIDHYPAIIERAVRSLQARCGPRPVALVCHSMGGLAARAYLRDYGSASVARVITLGTPHQGTFLANFSHAQNARQMRLQSTWRDTLASRESAANRALFTIIFSHHDNIAMPQSIQTIDGANIIASSGKGHVRLALDAEIWQMIADDLTATPARN
jgi:pimeloyl-ACP methyl ester carboxylesterase